jgi:hypothetical protein
MLFRRRCQRILEVLPDPNATAGQALFEVAHRGGECPRERICGFPAVLRSLSQKENRIADCLVNCLSTMCRNLRNAEYVSSSQQSFLWLVSLGFAFQ